MASNIYSSFNFNGNSIDSVFNINGIPHRNNYLAEIESSGLSGWFTVGYAQAKASSSYRIEASSSSITHVLEFSITRVGTSCSISIRENIFEGASPLIDQIRVQEDSTPGSEDVYLEFHLSTASNSTTKAYCFDNMTDDGWEAALSTPGSHNTTQTLIGVPLTSGNTKSTGFFEHTHDFSEISGVPDSYGATGPQGETGVRGETGLKGDQGDAFQVDFWGILDESVISTVEAGSYTAIDPYMQVVTDDLRSNTSLPASLSGDKSRHAVSYDGTNWYNFGEFTGIQGETGAQGLQGETGLQGATGLEGSTGAQGVTGLKGEDGIIGVDGATGVQGETGLQGATGLGIQGETGIQGVTGPAGTTNTKTVEATNASWAAAESNYVKIADITAGTKHRVSARFSITGWANAVFQGSSFNSINIEGYLSVSNFYLSGAPEAFINITNCNYGENGPTEQFRLIESLVLTDKSFYFKLPSDDTINQLEKVRVSIFEDTHFLAGSGGFGDLFQDMTPVASLSDTIYAEAETVRAGSSFSKAPLAPAPTEDLQLANKAYVDSNAGTTGAQGIQGETGVQGIQGETGVQGIQGTQGETGVGLQGATGVQGPAGNDGLQGETGSIGLQGATGAAGDALGFLSGNLTANEVSTGQTSLNSGWNIRGLNTEANSRSAKTTFDGLSSTITLEPGTYRATAQAFGNGVGSHYIAIIDTSLGVSTSSTDQDIIDASLIVGMETRASSSDDVATAASLAGIINVTAITSIQLWHRVETSQSDGASMSSGQISSTILIEEMDGLESSNTVSYTRVNSSTSVSMTTSPRQLPIDTESDTKNLTVDIPNNKIVITEDGYYNLNAHYYFSDPTDEPGEDGPDYFSGYIYKNGSSIEYSFDSEAKRYALSTNVSGTHYLQAGDEITFWASIGLSRSGQVGRLLQATAFKASSLNTSYTLDKTVEIPDWAPSTYATQDRHLMYQGILFRALQSHTTSAIAFMEDADKWEVAVGNVMLVNQPGHGFLPLDPVYEDNDTWYQANSINQFSLASHVVIDSSQDWMLLSDKGIFSFPAHGLANGLHYCNDTGTGYTTDEPVDNFINPCLKVTDPNEVAIVSFMPATDLNLDYVHDSERLIADITLVEGILLDTVIPYDGEKYPRIRIEAKVSATLNSSTKNVSIQFNGSTGSEFARARTYAGRAASGGTQPPVGDYAVLDRIEICNYAANRTGYGITNGYVKNEGTTRSFLVEKSYSGSSLQYLILSEANTWVNTSDDLTSIRVYSSTTAAVGFVRIYGRPD
jgi:hypothetical protein